MLTHQLKLKNTTKRTKCSGGS